MDPTENPHAFPATRWSMVLRVNAGSEKDLEELCKRYWYPLYAYVRRYGKSPEDAEDLTQGFFSKLLEKEWLQHASEEKAKLRTFLLTRLQRFTSDEWKKATAAKRGGGEIPLSIDREEAEGRYTAEPADDATPETLFHQAWASTLLSGVLKQLEKEFSSANKQSEFTALQPCLAWNQSEKSYFELAKELGKTEGWVKTTVRRMRLRYREILEQQIGDTVADRTDITDEVNALFSAF